MLYTLYFAENDKYYCIRYSPNISFDALYLGEKGYNIYPLTVRLPLGVIHFLWKQVAGNNELRPKSKRSSGFFLKLLKRDSKSNLIKLRERCNKLLTKMGLSEEILDSEQDRLNFIKDETRKEITGLETLFAQIQGRVLLHSEVEKSLRETGLSMALPLELAMQQLYLQGKVDILPGVGYLRPGELKCNRCGGQDKIVRTFCSRCNRVCYYCEECIMLGASRFCETLYITKSLDQHLNKVHVEPRLPFESLTLSQISAGQELVQFINDPSCRLCLVMAVCGAGKTEVAFQGIAEALVKGCRILYAAPRRDVVAELYPRFCEAFPGITITAAYGGSDKKYQEAQLTLATNHQVIRFNQRFDLVVLDEADAYPYRGNPMLYNILERARKKGSKIIYITATPDSNTYRKAEAEGIVINIPARYHGQPLPVPTFMKSSVIHRDRSLDPKILQWLYEKGIKDKARVLIFVPTVAQTRETAALLRKSFDDGNCAHYLHSRDKERDLKRKAFQEGGYPFLVTTTILERGVTIPNVHVLVLWADNEKVFNKGTLVQIAGRVGRTMECPWGEVLFAAPKVTNAMTMAVKELNRLNYLAEEKGFLK